MTEKNWWDDLFTFGEEERDAAWFEDQPVVGRAAPPAPGTPRRPVMPQPEAAPGEDTYQPDVPFDPRALPGTPTRSGLADVMREAPEQPDPAQTTEAGLNPAGVGMGRAVERGVLRTRATEPMLRATEAGTALQDARRTNPEILRDTWLAVTGLQEVPEGVDLSSPESAAIAIGRLGFQNDRSLTFTQRYQTRLQLAEAARADPEKYQAEYEQNIARGQGLLDRASEIPMSPAASRLRESLATDETFFGTLRTMVNDPAGTVAFLAETAGESAPQIAAATAAGVVTRNPAVSGAILGAGTIGQEYGASVGEFFQENGVRIESEEDARALLENADLLRKANERGLTRGVVIAAFETLGQGVAAREFFSSPVGEAALQATVQALTGSGGEAAARAAAGQEFNAQEVLIEGLAELLTAPAEVGAASIGASSRAPREEEPPTAPRTPPGAPSPLAPPPDAPQVAALTAEDRASPIPDQPIAEGRAIIDEIVRDNATVSPAQPEAGVAPLPDINDIRTPRTEPSRTGATELPPLPPSPPPVSGQAPEQAVTRPPAQPDIPEGAVPADEVFGDAPQQSPRPPARPAQAAPEPATDGRYIEMPDEAGNPGRFDTQTARWEPLPATTTQEPDAATTEDVQPQTQEPVARPVPPAVGDDAGPAQVIPTREGRADIATTPSGRSVNVKYAVVEASQLTTSNAAGGAVNPNYPRELQPRDRTRGTSQEQVRRIAQNLNPRLLGENPSATDGAPIISPDGVVESGNGRTLAIQQAYDQGGAEAYRKYLQDQGYDVSGMERPVLVRVRQDEMSMQDRAAFARDANERTTAAMSSTERAMADASAMPDNLMGLYRGGDIDAAGNRDFVRAFIQSVVSESDRAQMIDASGAMSQDAVRRVQGALLARAYGDANLVAALMEASDGHIKAIGGALMDVAASWAQMRQEAKSGTIAAEMDQTAALLEAVRIVDRARRDRRNVAEFVGQGDLLAGDSISPMGKDFLALMFRNVQSWTQPAGRDKIAQALGFYVEQARETQAGADMFGATADPAAVVQEAKRRQYDNGQDGQGDLLAQARQQPGDGDGAGVRADRGERDRPDVPQGGEAEGAAGARQSEQVGEVVDARASQQEPAGGDGETEAPDKASRAAQAAKVINRVVREENEDGPADYMKGNFTVTLAMGDNDQVIFEVEKSVSRYRGRTKKTDITRSTHTQESVNALLEPHVQRAIGKFRQYWDDLDAEIEAEEAPAPATRDRDAPRRDGVDAAPEGAEEPAQGFPQDLTEAIAKAKTVKGKQSAADKWVLRQGKAEGVEYAVILDRNGQVIDVQGGSRSNVDPSASAYTAAAKGNVGYATHNHPASRGFSVGDIRMVAIGFSPLAAIGHRRGSRHVAEQGFLKDVDRSDASAWDDLTKALTRIDDSLRGAMQERINNGALDFEAANATHAILFGRLLDRIGAIKYTGDGESVLATFGVDENAILDEQEAAARERFRWAGYDVPEAGREGRDSGAGEDARADAAAADGTGPATDDTAADDGDGRVRGPEGLGAPEDIGPRLYVVHNLSAENLRNVLDLGGSLAAPSLAIARADIGFDNFGEISLIGGPSMADPRERGVKAFNADVYSPRQPRAQYDINGPAFKRMMDVLGPAAELIQKSPQGNIDPDRVSREGLAALEHEEVVQMAYLMEVGQAPRVRLKEPAKIPVRMRKWRGKRHWEIMQDPAFAKAVAAELEAEIQALPEDLRAPVRGRKFNDDGTPAYGILNNRAAMLVEARGGRKVDRFETDRAIRKRMDETKRRRADFRQWISDNFGDVLGAKFFRTDSGRRKPYEIDALVREMTRTIRDGEGWNYGVGSIRSMVAVQFKSLSGVKKARGQIVDAEAMRALKDEANDELVALSEKFAPYHASGQDFGWLDIFSEFLKDLSRGRVREWQTQIFNSPVPSELLTEARVYLEKLRDMPTEYFEVKMQRAVDLSEFEAALVPSKAPADVVQALRDKGLKIIRYGDGPNARGEAAQRVPEAMFARPRTVAPQDVGMDPRDTGSLARGRVLYETTPRFRGEARRVAGDLRTELRKLNLPNIEVRVAERAFGVLSDGTLASIDGVQLRDLILIALDSGRSAASALRHEVIHALRNPNLWGKETGLFRPAEWRALERAALADTEAMAESARDYPGESREVHIEETIARMYEAWSEGRMEATGFVAAGMRAIRNAIEAIGNALRGNGFTTADSVFSAIERGDVGARQGQAAPARRSRIARGGVSMAVREAARRMTDSPAFKRWFGDSKVVDENGEPLVVYHHGTFSEDSDTPAGEMHFGTRAAAEQRAFDKRTEEMAMAVGVYQNDDGVWHWEQDDGWTSEDAGHPGFADETTALEFGRSAVMNDVYEGALDSVEVDDLGVVTAAYLSLKNPKRVVDVGGANGEWVGVIAAAKAQGHDGIVYRNKFEDVGSDSYIAFSPTQIKSVNNRGTFDPADDRINFAVRMDDIFFSPLLRAIEGAKQKQAPAKDWKAIIAKLPGVKKAEVDWLGVEDWLDSQEGTQVPREALAEFVRASQVELVEERLAGEEADVPSYSIDVESDNYVEPDWEAEAEFYLDEAESDLRDEAEADGDDPDDISAADIQERAEEMARERWEPTEFRATLYPDDDGAPTYEGWFNSDDQTYSFEGLGDFDSGADAESAAVDAWQDDGAEGADGPARFESYTEGGGTNYREVLLRVPDLHKTGKNVVKPTPDQQRRWDELSDRITGTRPWIADPQERAAWIAEQERLSEEREALAAEIGYGKDPFVQSAHFDAENIVVHARLKDRQGANGESVLFVEEIQSDLASKWREATESPEVTARRRELEAERYGIIDRQDAERERIAEVVGGGATSLDVANMIVRVEQARDAGVEDPRSLMRDELKGLYSAVMSAEPGFIENYMADSMRRQEISRSLLALGTERTMDPSVPDTPFKEEHTYTLMVKRLLREAAEKGYNRLSWTPATVQAERWNNGSQVVKGYYWSTTPDGNRIVDVGLGGDAGSVTMEFSPEGALVSHTGRTAKDGSSYLVDPGGAGRKERAISRIDQMLPKRLADQVLSEARGENAAYTAMIDLNKSGYAIAYDQQIRKAVEAFAKRYGGRVYEDRTLPDFGRVVDSDMLGPVVDGLSSEDAMRAVEAMNLDESGKALWREAIKENGPRTLMRLRPRTLATILGRIGASIPSNPVWSIDITPEMRDAALEPMPMFAVRRTLKPSAAENIARQTNTPHIPDRRLHTSLLGFNRQFLRQGVRGAASDALDRIRIWGQDQFLAVRRAEEAIERLYGTSIPKSQSAYYAEERYSGRVGRRLEAIDERYARPIIKLIARQATPFRLTDKDGNAREGYEAVNLFLWARHALERNRQIASINDQMQDGGSGLTDAEANAILAEARNLPNYRDLERIGKLTDRLGREMIDLRKEAGLLSAQEALIWRTQYKHYVPLKGFAETDMYDAIVNENTVPRGRKFNVRGKEDRQALGRSTEAFDPLATLLTQAQEVSIRAEKNHVAKILHNLVSNNPAPAMWEVKAPQTERFFNRATGRVETRVVGPLAGQLGPNEMALKIDGKEHRIVLHDPRLARALGKLGTSGMEDARMVLRAAQRFGQWFSMANTMLNPEFVITNAFRDMQTAQINLRGFVGKQDISAISKAAIKTWPKALMGSYRAMSGKRGSQWAQHFRDYEAAGGKVSFWRIDTPEAGGLDLQRRIRLESGGRGARALKKATALSIRDNALLNWMDRANLAVDNAVRLAVFVEARNRGWSKEDAASLAKNLTVNFNRKGEAGSAINAWWVFFNAAVQGNMTMLRAMKNNPKKMGAIVGALVVNGMLSDLLNAGLSEEDDDGELEYDKIAHWKMERNIIVPDVFGLGDGDDFGTIPMPWGYNVFHYAGVQIGKVARGVKDPSAAFADLARATFAAFSPISDQDFARTIAPTIGDLGLDLVLNEDWTGKPIRPEPAYADYGPQAFREWNATETAKAISRTANYVTGGSMLEAGWLDVSPEYIDHVVAFLGGGAVRFGQRVADLGAKAATGQIADVETYQVPFARVLVTETADFLDRNRYYTFREVVNSARAMDKRAKENDTTIAAVARKPERMEAALGLYDDLRRAEKRRRELDDKLDAIYADDTLSARERAEKLRPVQDKLHEVYMDFNAKFIEAMGPQAE